MKRQQERELLVTYLSELFFKFDLQNPLFRKFIFNLDNVLSLIFIFLSFLSMSIFIIVIFKVKLKIVLLLIAPLSLVAFYSLVKIISTDYIFNHEDFKKFIKENNVSTKDFFLPLLNKNFDLKNKKLFEGFYKRLDYLLNNVSEMEKQNFEETCCLLESFFVLEELYLAQEQKKQQYKSLKNICFKSNAKKTLELRNKIEKLNLKKEDLLELIKILLIK